MITNNKIILISYNVNGNYVINKSFVITISSMFICLGSRHSLQHYLSPRYIKYKDYLAIIAEY